jgi:hypothetical protein
MSLIIHRFLDNILFSTITWIILFMFSNDVQVMIHKKNHFFIERHTMMTDRTVSSVKEI